MDSGREIRAKTTKKGGRSTRGTEALASGKDKPKQREIKPSDIHELRLKTTQIQQQTRLMKTQLNRIKDRISSTTKQINETVSNKKETSKVDSHQTAIKNIKMSIAAAEATIKDLDKQIKDCQEDDKSALVEELQEELKVAYCEYQRLKDTIDNTEAESEETRKKFAEADAKTSKQHTTELNMSISQLREANRALKEKIVAYNKKMERNKIEKVINERNQIGLTQEYYMMEINDTKRYRTEKYNMIAEELNKEMDDFDKKVEELNKIINTQRSKIIAYLTGKAQKDGDEHVNEEEEIAE